MIVTKKKLKFNGEKINTIELELSEEKCLFFKNHSIIPILKQNFLNFLEEQFWDGENLLKEGYSNNIEIPDKMIKISHNKNQSIALCNYDESLDKFSPFINIKNFLEDGWVFDKGYLKDVFINKNNSIIFYSNYTLKEHDLCFYWILNKVEKLINDFSIEGLERFIDNWNESYYELQLLELYSLFSNLKEITEFKFNNNHKKQWKYLKIKNMTPEEYILKYNLYKHTTTINEIFKMSIFFGKSFSSTKKYLLKNGK